MNLLLLCAAVLSLVPIGLLVLFIYLMIRYQHVIVRVFEDKPMFLPSRLSPLPDAEPVRFETEDGLRLTGSYLRQTGPSRMGTLIFCHEYLGDRWSVQAYLGPLRDMGFDLFCFDFRNHGDSESEAGYTPSQWVTSKELSDLQAAVRYVTSRPDADPAGVGLFGVSRGGAAALCLAADDPRVWAVLTDGAFSTHGTMLAYMLRWAEVYVRHPRRVKYIPKMVLAGLASSTLLFVGRRRGCKFPRVESAVRRLAPRPWLQIHGQRDSYISTAIAETLFNQARAPKESWIVPKAKHNRSHEVAGAEYHDRIAAFLAQFGPRRMVVDGTISRRISEGRRRPATSKIHALRTGSDRLSPETILSR